MFKKNTAVTGFAIGHFINASTGAAVTTGTPVCKRMLDGTGAACANAAAYNTDAAQWEIDLDAADTNGDMVGLSFTLTDCLPISFSFRTTTKLTSDLNDLSAAQVNAEADTALSDAGVTSTVTGRIDAAISTRSTLTAAQVNAEVDTALSDAGVTSTVTGRIDAAVSSRSTLTAQQVWEYATRTIASVSGAVASVTAAVTVGTNNDKTGYSLATAPPTAAAIATAVWAETTRTLSSYGALVSDIATAVWGATTRLLSGPVETDEASRNASKADVSGLALETTAQAILEDTGTTLPATLASILEDTGTSIPASIALIDSPTGSGSTAVTHATLDDDGDDMYLKTAAGAGIGGATVQAYITSEYAAGTYDVKATTRTIDSGAWLAPLYLDAENYTIVFSKSGNETATTTVTVS